MQATDTVLCDLWNCHLYFILVKYTGKKRRKLQLPGKGILLPFSPIGCSNLSALLVLRGWYPLYAVFGTRPTKSVAARLLATSFIGKTCLHFLCVVSSALPVYCVPIAKGILIHLFFPDIFTLITDERKRTALPRPSSEREREEVYKSGKGGK